MLSDSLSTESIHYAFQGLGARIELPIIAKPTWDLEDAEL